ncbi:hypothetical protein BDV95DRAFT_606521 [Massariosphaeria phaeospora]|uniref:Mid2 domain-containing protein n=1 Tax=Massariosphaeria phaeospora TaxID=100035 RepID=A0A7C8IE85_9PLEO|nr:hypothetical protein BDV95DRAFT_606521 [Massariosphaeria phaeospora]
MSAYTNIFLYFFTVFFGLQVPVYAQPEDLAWTNVEGGWIFEIGRTFYLTYVPADDIETKITLRNYDNSELLMNLTDTATGGWFTWTVSESLNPGSVRLELRRPPPMAFDDTIVYLSKRTDTDTVSQSPSPIQTTFQSASMNMMTKASSSASTLSVVMAPSPIDKSSTMSPRIASPTASPLASSLAPMMRSNISTASKVGIVLGAVSAVVFVGIAAFVSGRRVQRKSATNRRLSPHYKHELDGSPIVQCSPTELESKNSEDPGLQELPVEEVAVEMRSDGCSIDEDP